MKCISRPGTTYQKHLKPLGRRHGKPERRQIGSETARPVVCRLRASAERCGVESQMAVSGIAFVVGGTTGKWQVAPRVDNRTCQGPLMNPRRSGRTGGGTTIVTRNSRRKVQNVAADNCDNSHSFAFNAELPKQNLIMHLIVSAHWESLEFELPLLADGRRWRRWIDTFLPTPGDICDWDAAMPIPRVHVLDRPQIGRGASGRSRLTRPPGNLVQ